MDVVRPRMALDKLDMLGVRVLGGTASAVVLLVQMAALPVHADTMESALLRAYRNNPQLNAQRASVRAVDSSISSLTAASARRSKREIRPPPPLPFRRRKLSTTAIRPPTERV